MECRKIVTASSLTGRTTTPKFTAAPCLFDITASASTPRDPLLTFKYFTSSASAQICCHKFNGCADAVDVKYSKVNSRSVGIDAHAMMLKRYDAAGDLGVVGGQRKTDKVDFES